MTCIDRDKEEKVMVKEVRTSIKKRWYSYKSIDGEAKGFNLAENETELARNVGYLPEELEIEEAEWDGEEFVVK